MQDNLVSSQSPISNYSLESSEMKIEDSASSTPNSSIPPEPCMFEKSCKDASSIHEITDKKHEFSLKNEELEELVTESDP